MAVFSTEPSTLKCWLVANLKIWAFIPMFVIIMVVGLIHNVFAVSPIEMKELVVYALIPAMAEGLLTAGQQTSQPMASYALLMFTPIAFMVFYHMGKIMPEGMSTGIVVWLWLSIAISMTVAYLVAMFAYKNSDEVLSKLFLFRSTNLEVFESRMKLAFSCFVEAYLIVFLTFAAMIMFAVD